MSKKISRESKKIRKLVNKDIKNEKFDCCGTITVNKVDKNGVVATVELKRDDIVDCICMTSVKLGKKFPIDYKDEICPEIDNNKFYESISSYRRSYIERVDRKSNKITEWIKWIIGIVVAVIGVGGGCYFKNR